MDIHEIRQILAKVPEPHRKKVEDLISGSIVQEVICGMCGRIIATISKDNQIDPTIDGNGRMWLLAYRYRLDGYLGFQCLCGNDSRLSAQEVGNRGIEVNRVTKKDVESVLEKVKKSPSVYPKVGNEQKIDNFCIRDLV